MKPGKPLQRKTRLRPKAAKVKRGTIVHRQEVRAERTVHREETGEIRAFVFERAGGKCECSVECQREPTDLDHWAGRIREPQSVENTWALNFECHRRKTEWTPSRLVWTERWRNHVAIERYDAQIEKADAAIESLRLKAMLPIR